MSLIRRCGASAAIFLAVSCAAQPHAAPAGDPMPLASKKPVVDTYHGVAVTDDYRWLEDADDSEVKAWSDAQSARARAWLDALPATDAIRRRITALLKDESVTYRWMESRGGMIFAMKDQRPKQQAFLVARRSVGADALEVVIVDPNLLDPAGTTSIDFYVPSLDGKRVAVSISEGGSESGTVHCYETATGKEVGEPVPRVNGGTAGGSVAWNADGTGFFYTRYPRAGERPEEDLDFFQQVYFHEIGTPTEKDRYEVGREFPRIAEIQLQSSDDGRHVLASVSNGDGGEYAHWLRDGSGAWSQVTRFEDKVVAAQIGPNGGLYMLSHKDAPRGKLVRHPLQGPYAAARAKTIVAEAEPAIEWFQVTASRLFVVDQIGGPNQVRVFDVEGRSLGTLPLPPVASVEEVVRLQGDDVLVRSETYLDPPTWYVARADGSFTKTAISDPVTIDYSDAEVVREWAASKDGTRVPIAVVRKKGVKLDGNNPTLLYGYGGYGISMNPYYMRPLRVWLDQGGVYAVGAIRGGGEFGEQWHLAGNLTKKQNVFDDFAACARALIELGYTRPERLALKGGSNGGLLMGAMIAQHPEICRAVVASVGVFDMLRVEFTPNGAFNVTEFGTVKDPAHFAALRAYSPYHNVVDGTAYPSVLLVTGANDPRVEPWHSRKMLARLSAASTSGRPLLLRTSANAGHGGGSSLDHRIEQEVDQHAFLFHELGVDYRE